MPKFVVRADVLDHCVMGYTIEAEDAASARNWIVDKFWEPIPDVVRAEAPRLAGLVEQTQANAKRYGVKFIIRRSRAA